MTVDPHEIPADVVAVLFEHMPREEDDPDLWRTALAHVLSRWERDRDTMSELHAAWDGSQVSVHEHVWRTIDAKSAKIIGITQTFVLQDCRVCGEVKTTQLQGEWTLAEITEGKQT